MVAPASGGAGPKTISPRTNGSFMAGPPPGGGRRGGLPVHGLDGGDVPGAEAVPLADRLAVRRDDRRPARVDRERVGRVVHDRPVVVLADVVAVGDVLVEVVPRL